MPVRLENTWSGRVVALAGPEEIDPPRGEYASKSAKARAARDASKQKRLLDTLAKSKRWRSTAREVTPVSTRQAQNTWMETERRRIEAQVRAELEQQVANDAARAERAAGSVSPVQDDGAGEKPEGETAGPSVAAVRAWAKEAGYQVPARGKLPEDVVDAYKQAHSGA